MTDQDNERRPAHATPTSPRQRAIDAYDEARGRAADTLGQAPLIALAGGIAAGALIAALLPRTKVEDRAVRPTARRVKDGARAAYEAARDSGKERFGELGFSKEKGQETLDNFLQGLKDTAKASVDAATGAVRKS